MKRALIATLYNEADNVSRWWDCLMRQKVMPDFPPLLLFSKRRLARLRFRYLGNAACARGWLAGKLRGHPAPAGWRQLEGIYMSPEALRNLPK
jgi:hypothetical protein